METVFGLHIDKEEIIPQYAVEQTAKISTLREWQRKAIEFFFLNNNKAIYECCTGSGKTFMAIEILKRIWATDSSLKALIIVPKNVIMETGWYKELKDAGIPIQDIGVYYGNIKEISKVTITNIQNISKLPMELFDILIPDEVHWFGTKRLLPFIQREFKYKFGLSATLARLDEHHWDILKAFDYNTFKYTPEEALNDDVLNPFEFTNVGVQMDDEDYDTYETLTDELKAIMSAGGGFKAIMKSNNPRKFRMLSKINERKSLVSNYKKKFIVIKSIVNKHKNDKVLVFHQYNKQTSETYWHLLDVGVKAKIIHSGLSAEKREENLRDYKLDKFNVLLATKVLDEGYNLPKIDVGVITAGDSSPKQTIQRLGRILRKKQNASHLYQIYCINTIEQNYAKERSKMFKELCLDYREYEYNHGVFSI